MQVEGSTDNSTWTVLQDFATAPTVYTTYDYYYANYFKYYRIAVRALGAGFSTTYATYNDGGTSSSYVYINVDGSAPQPPSSITVTPDITTVTVTYTSPTNTGSNSLDYNYFSTDGTNYTTASGTTSPLTITGLSTGTYTFYLKATNAIGDSEASSGVSGTVMSAIGSSNLLATYYLGTSGLGYYGNMLYSKIGRAHV